MRIYRSPHTPKNDIPLTSVFEYIWSNPNNVPEDTVALVDSQDKFLTRKELRENSQRLAYYLVHSLGLQAGDVACIFSPNSIHYHVMVYACQCAGIVVSAANAAYMVDELHHQLEDSGSKLLLAHPAVLEVAEQATRRLASPPKILLASSRAESVSYAGRYLCLDETMGEKLLPPHRVKDPKTSVAYLGYSSGTTGKAKGVMTTHYNMCSVISMLHTIAEGPEHVQMAFLPLNHIYGLSKLVHWPIREGMKVVIMPRFDLEGYCSLVQKHKITCTMLVPPVALLLAKDPRVSSYDLSSLKIIVSGAAPLGKEMEDTLSARLGGNCFVTQAYGLTETSPTTHYRTPEFAMPGSIGPLLPRLEARIVNPETLEDVAEEQEGEMWIRGPNVMLGYLNRPEQTKESIVQGGWLRTGDVAYVKNNCFFITDRIKELIKYKGFQVPPAELESLLLQHPAIADAGVIGVYNASEQTELPRAYVVRSEGSKVAEKEIEDWVASKVSNPKRLRGGVRFVDFIPKSPSGKILRRVIKDWAKADEPKTAKAKL
ncbi:acetyl-CoA synthetase-like protein [Atractiella rhizophila]|nr:acetyl-CoA synthetase-like protein [Atractiella rhizophila]